MAFYHTYLDFFADMLAMTAEGKVLIAVCRDYDSVSHGNMYQGCEALENPITNEVYLYK